MCFAITAGCIRQCLESWLLWPLLGGRAEKTWLLNYNDEVEVKDQEEDDDDAFKDNTGTLFQTSEAGNAF